MSLMVPFWFVISSFYSLVDSVLDTDNHSSQLQKSINEDFGSFETFRKQMNTTLAGIQGSGWAWLAKDKQSGTLGIITRANQDPVSGSYAPLLGIDAWEHAYYLQYENRKAEYFDAIWNIVNWKTVATRFEKA